MSTTLREATADHEGLLDSARKVVALATGLGADECRVRVGRGVSTELSRRDGRIEKAEESRSRAMSVSLMVDGRWSAHSTSDLREGALRAFLTRAIEGTRFLEPDPDRALPPLAEMGSADVDALDAWDDAILGIDQAARRAGCEALEDAVRAAADGLSVRSVTSGLADGYSARAIVTSHGFESTFASTWVSTAAVISLEDAGGRLPEAWYSSTSRHADDALSLAHVAARAVERARDRLGSGPAKSGRYPMLLDQRITGRVLGTALSPLSGELLYEKRSCLDGKLGEKLGSDGFTILDDPLIPRGSGSKPHDGDGIPARRRALFQDGVLETFLIDVYNARRLGTAPTGGSTGNLVVPPGERSPGAILASLPRAIRVDGFLGGNANPTTGDFSFGVHGVLFEHGEPVANVSEMNISGNVLDLLPRFAEAASDVWTLGAWRTPSLLFDDVQFSGS
ncbi:MAG: TldD/PmbA family protein [Alphaproteobacteria bacterium]|nr:TldD/PmbA family protein [Alphaproteobacteria bacterium]